MFNIDESSGFDITQLSLSGVQAATGVVLLPPGRYLCRIKGIKLESTKLKDGKFLAVSLVEINNKGSITARLNVQNKSAEATRIGMEQLKGLAESCGAADPNQPFAQGLTSLDGMEVGVIVKADNYNGKTSSQVSGFCKPNDVGAQDGAPAAAGSIGLGDVPF
ncbi:hypothetical protein UFOVP708_52 [uncultured Caudovirales phage]|uniref:DUF669 domain-containing protein n=1 Tax=uncultured Caudovirales phage TaxID=2100421 RepID=A0A6J5NIH4_9CAUD|nr:hypothetical protein UFOVP708_52 [uncultured Caudovirales phage]